MSVELSKDIPVKWEIPLRTLLGCLREQGRQSPVVVPGSSIAHGGNEIPGVGVIDVELEWGITHNVVLMADGRAILLIFSRGRANEQFQYVPLDRATWVREALRLAPKLPPVKCAPPVALEMFDTCLREACGGRLLVRIAGHSLAVDHPKQSFSVQGDLYDIARQFLGLAASPIKAGDLVAIDGQGNLVPHKVQPVQPDPESPRVSLLAAIRSGKRMTVECDDASLLRTFGCGGKDWTVTLEELEDDEELHDAVRHALCRVAGKHEEVLSCGACGWKRPPGWTGRARMPRDSDLCVETFEEAWADLGEEPRRIVAHVRQYETAHMIADDWNRRYPDKLLVVDLRHAEDLDAWELHGDTRQVWNPGA